MIGADPAGSVYSGGTGRPYLVEGVGEDFWPECYDRDVADRIIEVSDADSFAFTRRLAREEALLVGGSSGMAAYAAKQLAARARRHPRGRERRDRGAAAGLRPRLPDQGLQRRVAGAVRLPGRGRPRRDTQTVGEVLRGKDGRLPDLVHTHPAETIAEAVHILQEYGVSQMPVVRAEPPIVAAEVAGSVSERTLLDALFAGSARLTDPVEQHMSRRCRRSAPPSRPATRSSCSRPRTRCWCTRTASRSACSPGRTCWPSSPAADRTAPRSAQPLTAALV